MFATFCPSKLFTIKGNLTGGDFQAPIISLAAKSLPKKETPTNSASFGSSAPPLRSTSSIASYSPSGRTRTSARKVRQSLIAWVPRFVAPGAESQVP